MKRYRKHPASKDMRYEPIRITPDQALDRLYQEIPELADFTFDEDRRLYILHIGAIKTLLKSLIDAGWMERVKAVLALLETLAREGDQALQNALAVGLLEHLPDLGPRHLETVHRMMGATTRRLYDGILAYNEALRATRLSRKARDR